MDICTRRIAGLTPTPAFNRIVEHAVTQSASARCLVLTQERAEALINESRQSDESMVWMVETRGN